MLSEWGIGSLIFVVIVGAVVEHKIPFITIAMIPTHRPTDVSILAEVSVFLSLTSGKIVLVGGGSSKAIQKLGGVLLETIEG
jgi:hypothetical protein